MCYTAGPRCSPHALTKLFEAKATFNQVDPTDSEKMNEAKDALFLAQEEYLTSPAGIKKLRDKAKATGDNKYALEANQYAAKRKAQIAASKALVAEQNKALATVEQKATLKESPDSEAVKRYEEESRNLQKDFDKLEKFTVPDNLVTKKINAETDNDGTQCGYDGYCNAPESDYCRDSEYINLRVDENTINTRGTLADIYDCNEDDIPDELETIGREELGLDNAENYTAESEYGYYGVEGSYVTLATPFAVQDRLKEYYDTEHKKLKAREAELEKNAPKVKDPEKPVSRSRPGAPKKGTVTTSTTKTAPKRRERSAAELDAFEKDAMPDPADRKPRVAKAVRPVAPKRRERTPAELDAFERDAMPDPTDRKPRVPKVAKPVAPKRRERTPAELDAFEADERS